MMNMLDMFSKNYEKIIAFNNFFTYQCNKVSTYSVRYGKFYIDRHLMNLEIIYDGIHINFKTLDEFIDFVNNIINSINDSTCTST